jgi:proteasome accessory factor B
MTRLERLINLLAALLEAGSPLSRAEVQWRVPGYEGSPDSTRRAFERDKETLRAMGVPLAVEPLDPLHPELGEGYRISREQYELPDPGLGPEELAALHLAVSVVRVGGASGQEAIWKLGGAPAGEAFGALVADLPGSEHLATLFAAMSARRAIRFVYQGPTGEAERVVDPFRLSFANGRWYLEGHDRDRAGERRFRLDRMTRPELGGPQDQQRRPRVESGPNQPWLMGDEPAVEARLLVDADQAGWAVARLGESAVRERRDDGAVVVALPVANREAFRSFVLGFLDHAEVLSPPELRAEVIEWLRALVYREAAA